MSWLEAVGMTEGVWCILSHWCWLSPSPAVLTDRQTEEGRQMDRCCTRSFSLSSWLVLYIILAFASYKVGSTAMAFGQVQGRLGGAWPSPPPEADTFKGSRATRTQHSCGKEVPLHEQDGPSHLGLSGTSHPHPRASRSTSGLSLVKGQGIRNGD